MGLEALGLGQPVDVPGHLALKGCAGGEIDDVPAPHAVKMVVVFGKVLGQFESRELVVGGDAPDQSRIL